MKIDREKKETTNIKNSTLALPRLYEWEERVCKKSYKGKNETRARNVLVSSTYVERVSMCNMDWRTAHD